jgi:hypothetical protein
MWQGVCRVCGRVYARVRAACGVSAHSEEHTDLASLPRRAFPKSHILATNSRPPEPMVECLVGSVPGPAGAQKDIHQIHQVMLHDKTVETLPVMEP